MRDRAVIITGAGGGLGRAYALYCAKLGASIVVNDVRAPVVEELAEELHALGATAIADSGSVADWDAAEAMVRRCVNEFGRVDGLVNNAAVCHETQPWDEEPGNLRRVLEVNLLGTMFCGVHALRAMRTQGSGSIVNVTSGAHLGLLNYSAYGASKGGVASLTYGWALECAGTGVRVNGISPLARTAMSESWFAVHDPESAADPGGVAPLVAFLLSDRSAGLNGRIIRLDRGALSIVAPPRIEPSALRNDRWTVDSIAEAVAGLGLPVTT